MAETIDLEFRANVADIKKKLKELPKDTAAAALKSVNEINKAIKATERQAKSLEKAEKRARWEAKKLGQEAADLKKKGKAGFESLKQAAEGVGGSVGATAGMVEKFGRSIFEASAAIGPLGTGAAAAAVGILAVGFGAAKAIPALFGIVTRAKEWLAVLDEAGASGDLITDAQRKSLDNAATSIGALTTAGQRLGVTIGTELAPEAESVADIMLVFATNAELVRFAVDAAKTAIVNMASALTGVNSVLITSALGMTAHAAATDENVLAIKDFGIEAEKATKYTDDLAAAVAAATKSHAADQARIAKQTKAAVDALRKQEAATRVAAAAAAQLARENDELGRSMAEAEVKFRNGQKALAAQAEAADIAAEAARKLAEANDDAFQADIIQATADAMETYTEFLGKVAGDIQMIGGIVTDAIMTFGDLRMEKLQEGVIAEKAAAQSTLDAWLEGENQRLDSMSRRRGFSEKDAILERQRIEDEAAAKQRAIKRIGREEAKAAKRTFRFQQAAQLGMAVVDAARAAIAMIPAHGFALAGAPAAAAVSAGIALATQSAVILAQKPPSFAFGGVVGDRMQSDHGLISAKPSEGIVSDRGMNAIGRDGLNQINSGQSMSTSVSVMIDRKVIASAVVDALSTDPQVSSALSARTGIPTGRALVYGQG